MKIAIMAHRKRQRMAENLSIRYNAPITWDEKSSPWDTGRRAWLNVLERSTDDSHGLVLQDDAYPCKGLLSKIRHMLEHAPLDSPVVLYAGNTLIWRDTFDALSLDPSFLVMDRIWWGPGIILPTRFIEKAIQTGDTLSQSHDQYDHMLGVFFHGMQIPAYYSWPSLVNHRGGPSLINGRVGKRTAYHFASQRHSQPKWDGRVVKVSPPLAAEAKFLPPLKKFLP